MRASAYIDTMALSHNLARAKALCPTTRVLAAIKSNGYGHGIFRVADALSGVDGFCVTNVEEALTLREAGYHQRILVLLGFSSPQELAIIRQHNLDTVVHHESQIEMLERTKPFPQANVWLKVDTGMHRVGLAPKCLAPAWNRLTDCSGVASPIRIMTHLPRADDRQNPYTQKQIQQFLSLASDFQTQTSIANSAAILHWPDAHTGWIRPGIMLYGISPFPAETGEELGLLPVMTLSTRLIAVNRIPRGEAVGYGGTWTCPDDMMVGVAAIGYGDGYPRHAPSGCPVLVNGRRVPIIGRVSMDMITLDLRTQPKARVGDEVVLWGKGLPVEEVARLSGTIGYELVCAVSARVHFHSGEMQCCARQNKHV